MKQPEALRLADVLERSVNNPHRYWQGEAAAELRRLHEVNVELLGALIAVTPYITTATTACHGDKCREPWCTSCNGDDDAEESAQKGSDAYGNAHKAIAKAGGAS